MKPQFFAMALASLGVMAVPDADAPECQEEHMKPWKGDIFTYESPTSNQTCDSVTITFPDGDPSKMVHTNISGDTGRCAKPEQTITLPSDISGLIRLDWQCAGRLSSPCRIITVKDESRRGLRSNAAASFSIQQSCPSATTASGSMSTIGGASTFRTTTTRVVPSSSEPSFAASPAASAASPAASAASPAASAASPAASSASPTALSTASASATTAALPNTTSNMSVQPKSTSPSGCTCIHS